MLADQFRATCTDAFRRRQRSGNIVARMRGLFRQIGIVVVEIANAGCIRECCPVRRRFVICADDCRSMLRRKFRNNFSRDRARLLIPRTERATERVEHAPLDFVNNFLRKIFEPERAGVFGKLMSKRF